MSEKYKFHDPEGLYFLSPTIIHWIDLFTRKEFRYIIIDALKYCQENKGLIVHAYCLMPSHLHLIVSSNGEPLEAIIRDFKKYTSREIIKTLNQINESRRDWLNNAFQKAANGIKRNSKNKVWQDGNRPKLLETNQFIQQKLEYIHNNPTEAEIVDEPEHYRYSSARDYSGMKGLIDVQLIC